MVLIVDSCNDCVRLVDCNSRQTLGFAGECNWPGFDSTHFRNPYLVIEDLKRKGQLIATDTDNNALRGINSSTGTINTVTSASTVLNQPTGKVQEPTSGDIYITANFLVLRFSCAIRFITSIVGSNTAGYLDGLFDETLFECIRLNFCHQNELVIADGVNNRLRILNLRTNITTSICSGYPAHGDGSLRTCSVSQPQAFLLLNETVYIGSEKRIRTIIGSRLYIFFILVSAPQRFSLGV